jgi:hypothetical protein
MRVPDTRIYPLWCPNAVGAPKRVGPRVKPAGDVNAHARGRASRAPSATVIPQPTRAATAAIRKIEA